MEAYGVCDKGRVRDINQDTIYYNTKPAGGLKNLFIVADGMGGHASGDFASRYTVEQLVDILGKQTPGPTVTLIDNAVRLVNNLLVRKAAENLDMYGMGTTLVLATCEDDIIYVANVGDSRLYLINDDIRQITRDHSYVEEMVSSGQLKRGSAEYYSKKNLITRAIGSPSGVTVDYFEIEVRENDYILMCSDGLTNMLTDDEILYIIRSNRNIKDATQRLVDKANEMGGNDNISALLFKPL